MQTTFACLLRWPYRGSCEYQTTNNQQPKTTVAIFHLSVKTVSRSAGRSSTAAAAYRAGVEITDRQTGEVHDYRRKSGIESAELFLPAGAPKWVTDRAELWNAAEKSETRKNSTVAREFEVALPAELSADQRRELAHDFSKALVKKYGFAADCAIHAPGKDGDSKNHHAHILCSTRKLTAEGFTAKTRELDDRATGAAQVVECRELFASMTNAALERAGQSVRVDHRSLEAQGIDREPTEHLGPSASAIERRGEVSQKTKNHQERQVEAASKVAALIAIAQAQAKAEQGRRAAAALKLAASINQISQAKAQAVALEAQRRQALADAQAKAEAQAKAQAVALEAQRRQAPIETRSAKEVWAASPDNPINQKEKEMATQKDHDLVAVAMEHREKYGYSHPSKEVLKAVDEVLIDQARARLGIPLPVEVVEPAPDIPIQQIREAAHPARPMKRPELAVEPPKPPVQAIASPSPEKTLLERLSASMVAFMNWLKGRDRGETVQEADLAKSQYFGPVVQVDGLHAFQRTGRGGAYTAHQLDRLDKLPALDDPKMEIKYRDGRGTVTGKEAGKEIGR